MGPPNERTGPPSEGRPGIDEALPGSKTIRANRTPAEYSAWLRGERTRASARPEVRALMRAQVAVVVPLGTGDRACDRCGTDTPVGEQFYLFMCHPEPGLHVVGGLCAGCERLEGGPL